MAECDEPFSPDVGDHERTRKSQEQEPRRVVINFGEADSSVGSGVSGSGSGQDAAAFPQAQPADSEPPEYVSVSASDIRGLEGIYQRCAGRTHNGLPLWEKVDYKRLLFYSRKKGRWYISDKLEDKGFAYAISDAESPLGLAWNGGTTLEVATWDKDIRKSSLRKTLTNVASLGKYISAGSKREPSTASSSNTSCAAEDFNSEASGASTATGGSTRGSLRAKRGMSPLTVRTG